MLIELIISACVTYYETTDQSYYIDHCAYAEPKLLLEYDGSKDCEDTFGGTEIEIPINEVDTSLDETWDYNQTFCLVD